MCDGTPCPCNILPRTDPNSRHYGRPPTATLVRRHAVRVATIGSVLVVFWAVALAVTGWAALTVLGPATIGLVLLAFLVALVAGACELGPRLVARERAARRSAYGPPRGDRT